MNLKKWEKVQVHISLGQSEHVPFSFGNAIIWPMSTLRVKNLRIKEEVQNQNNVKINSSIK